MSTAALRPVAPVEPDALVPAAHIYALISDLAQSDRDLASQRARNATLLREMKRLLQAPKLVGQSVVDGCLTLTYDSGRVIQLQPTAHYLDDATEYGHRWQELVPAPDTAASIVREATEAVAREIDQGDDFPFGMEVIA